MDTLTASPEIKQKEKVIPTDVQLCANIIFTFYHYPTKAYLTTDEIYSFLSEYLILDKERVENLLMELVLSWVIKHTTFSKTEKSEKEMRWHWSIRMSNKDGERPDHSGFKWHNSNEITH